MIDQIFQKKPKKPTRDLNIVPILSMLTTVIFFLLMSTSFIEYTKLTLPPSQSVAAPLGAEAVKSLAPILYVRPVGTPVGTKIELHLTWQGKDPGHDLIESEPEMVLSQAEVLFRKFNSQFPLEKTLQISLEKSIKYQTLISIMEATKNLIPDIVLLSYREVNQP